MTIHQDFPLQDLLYYRIGGNAAYVLEVSSHEDIVSAFSFIKEKNIARFLVVGLGSNLLMPDEDFDGAIVHVTKSMQEDIRLREDGLIESFAGQTLDDLIQFSFANKFLGLEILGGLPSTVGGAIRGNAGAFGVEMKDVVAVVEVLDLSNAELTTHELIQEQCQFAYRDSIFKKNPNLIILKGVFKLVPASAVDVAIARETYQDKIHYRTVNHPTEYPSCGSVFKNIREPEKVQQIIAVWPDIKESVETKWHGKVSMGYVNKRLGFLGTEVGGAMITDKHANYISNVHGAKAADVLTIIEQIRTKFRQTFGFYPELEAEIVK
ncbi:MAG: UDP-N-acetylmuramate dehydrogenase [Candidatus Levybacteria bacterium]|nr:UDP-N-acetylmuramate dehydrogenase [Candidatus Levybacteria bacterium]